MPSRRTTWLCSAGVALLTASAALAPAATAVPPSPVCAEPVAGHPPEARPPAEIGLAEAAVTDAIRFGTRHLAHAVQIYRHGCLAGEHDGTGGLPMPLASGSKGVAAVAVGRAVTLGHFELDDPLGTFFPHADAEHARITVRQILTQTSGLHFTWADDIRTMLAGDPVADALTAPVAAEPGTTFLYAQNILVLLAEIIEITTGSDFQDFVADEVMTPLGIDRAAWRWNRSPDGTTMVSGGLSMRPGDLARIGRLLLQEGRWADRTLLDPAFVRAGTSPTDANGGYGFLWWLNAGGTYRGVDVPAEFHDRPVFPGLPRDAFAFSGALGQFAVMIPSLDMVIIRLGVPDNFDPADPASFLTGTSNPNNAELFRRAAAAVVGTGEPAG